MREPAGDFQTRQYVAMENPPFVKPPRIYRVQFQLPIRNHSSRSTLNEGDRPPAMSEWLTTRPVHIQGPKVLPVDRNLMHRLEVGNLDVQLAVNGGFQK